MLYRIQTEDINRDSIIAIIVQNFESFTIIPAIGYWQGKPENSIIIEIMTDSKWHGTESDEHKVFQIADRIRRWHNQECVLISTIESESSFVR